jgi:hypothetical protein
MKNIQRIRAQIVNNVQKLCKENNLDYRETWKFIYEEYGERYKIYPHIHYKFGHKSKLDFLEAYEELVGTMSKMNELINEL